MMNEKSNRSRRNLFWLSLFAVLLFAATLPLFTLHADAKVVDSGYCGANWNNVSWTLDSDGVVTISGAGAMANYSYSYSPFYNNTSIISVVIDQGVTSIGSYMFCNCSSLMSVSIPNSVTRIGSGAFNSCTSIKSIPLPASVTSIEASAFYECSSLTSVEIPEGVTKISSYLFAECSSLTSVTIPSTVTTIEDSAFYHCSSLKSITIPNGVTSIGASAFNSCTSLTSAEIPDSVTSMGNAVFLDCTSLKSVTIGESVTGIGESAFANCSSLKSISIPGSVTQIGDDAFYRCDSLKKVEIYSRDCKFGTSVFPNTVELYGYVDSTTEAYAKSNNLTFVDITHTHTYGPVIVAREATCNQTGLQYQVCTTCGERANEVTIPKTDHSYTWVVDQNATCETPGLKHEQCSVCGATRNYNTVIPATGKHDYETSFIVDVSPTCTKEGSKSRHCKNCGAKTDVTPIPKAAHVFENEWHTYREATCIQKGKQYKKCINCDEKTWKTVAKTAHQYKLTITPASLTADGEVVKQCAVCGLVKATRAIPRVKTVKLKRTAYICTGSAITPKVIVQDAEGTALKKDKDYKLTYAKGRTLCGTYKIKVTFIGKYTGSKKLSFTISLGKVTGLQQTDKSGINIKWNTVLGADGYIVQYYNTDAKSWVKWGTKGDEVKNPTWGNSEQKGSRKIRVCAYQIVNGEKVTGPWSNILKATAK